MGLVLSPNVGQVVHLIQQHRSSKSTTVVLGDDVTGWVDVSSQYKTALDLVNNTVTSDWKTTWITLLIHPLCLCMTCTGQISFFMKNNPPILKIASLGNLSSKLSYLHFPDTTENLLIPQKTFGKSHGVQAHNTSMTWFFQLGLPAYFWTMRKKLD